MTVLYYLACYRRGEPEDVSAFAKETFFFQSISDWIIEHLHSAEGRFIKLLPLMLIVVIKTLESAYWQEALPLKITTLAEYRNICFLSGLPI